MENEGDIVFTQPSEEVAKWIVIGAIFVALGVAAIVFAGGNLQFAGILSVVIFGLVLVIGVIQLIKPSQLIIGDEGFTRISYPFNAKGDFLAWDQVSYFEVGAGGRGGPSVGFMKSAEAAKTPQPVYAALHTMGMDAFELADLMNQRRSRAVGEALPKPKKGRKRTAPAPRKPTAPVRAAAVHTIDFPASATGRAPAVSGSYAYIAKALLSASQIAERFGEKLVDGIVDGKASKAVVAPVVEVGELVFVKAGLSSRVLMPEDGDYDEGLRIAKTLSQGRVRRAASS